jgi:hypothetical protein
LTIFRYHLAQQQNSASHSLRHRFRSFAEILTFSVHNAVLIALNHYTVSSESRYALRLRYVDLVVSIAVAVEVCFCFTASVSQTAAEVQYR